VNAGIDHAVSGYPHEKRCRFVAHQLFIKVDAPVHIIIGRRPEPGCIGLGHIQLPVGFTARITGSEKTFYIHISGFEAK
jgi:hypothetical protein